MGTRSQKRWLCNELVSELCKEIPTVKTADRILLTAHKMYAYLAPQFSKKLIYRDAIAFLKALLNAKKDIEIRISKMARNNKSQPIVVIKQLQWKYAVNASFALVTNKYHIFIGSKDPCYVYHRNGIFIFDAYDQLKCNHLQYFLRLIEPILQPIQLYLNRDSSDIPIPRLVRFLNAQSDWIDSTALWDDNFDSEPIYGALMKYNKLKIYDTISSLIVPKLVHWLTENNNNSNGQPKKYLVLRQDWLNGGLVLLIDKLKKEFARTTNKSRFVVRLHLRQQLNEFTLSNELTGEKLQLRRKNMNDGHIFIHTLLTRSLNNGSDDSENDCAELEDPFAEIYLH